MIARDLSPTWAPILQSNQLPPTAGSPIAWVAIAATADAFYPVGRTP